MRNFARTFAALIFLALGNWIAPAFGDDVPAYLAGQNPYLPSTWLNYQTYAITGYFVGDPADPRYGQLDVWTAGPVPPPYNTTANTQLRRTYLPLSDQPYTAQAIIYTVWGQTPPADWRTSKTVLIEGTEAIGGKSYIGEKGGFGDYNGLVITPKLNIADHILPELPNDPADMTKVTGSVTGQSTNPATGGLSSGTESYWFKNLGPGTGPGKTWWWPQYPDQLRTVLVEIHSDGTQIAYNYLYAKNIGMVMIWWITVGPDGKGSGWMWQIQAFGPN